MAAMKKVLSLLVVFVTLNVHTWAFAPVYPTTAQSVTGTYSGVLTPVVAAIAGGNAASIGVFAVGIPSSTTGSIVTGAGVIFSNGAAYNSLINGVFDPASSTLSAIIEGDAAVASTSTSISGNQTGFGTFNQTATTNTLIFAQGNMMATLTPASVGKNRTAAQSQGPGTAGAERLNGTATVDLFSSVVPPTTTSATGVVTANANAGAPIVTSTVAYTINGFQQSSTFSTPTIVISVPTAANGATGS
jgi:hypothetical protein